MDDEEIIGEIERYESVLSGILSHFTKGRDAINIRRGDEARLRQAVGEMIDLFNDTLGRNRYSVEIAQAFNDGISNFHSSPSYHSVETIIAIVRAAITRLKRNPDLLHHKKAQESRVQGEGSLSGLHPGIYGKCHELYENGAFAEAVEKGFKVVRDRLRELTGYEKGSEAFGKGKLHIKGAAAKNVDKDFNEAVKFLTMAIDFFRNEKSHTSDARIEDPVRAYEYLRLSSLALNLLEDAEISP
jgi:uncharacterized protein (TIGR02391 family)